MAIIKIVAQNFDLVDDSNPTQTGKISCLHLFKAHVSGVFIGHPEIDNDLSIINQKLKNIISLRHNHPTALPFNVIFIGETLEEFSNNSLLEIAQIVRDNCQKIFLDIPNDFIKQSLLIYEPRWITYQTDNQNTLPQSQKLITRVTTKLRDFLTEKLGPAGLNISLMYGEVSSPERAIEILSDENLQGIILGPACSSAEYVLDFVKALQHAFNKRKFIIICNLKTAEPSEGYQAYLSSLAIIPDNFTIYIAPPLTEIKALNELARK
ncbi:MAG TPA: triose-phosphate isomerase [Candidatus Bathyarchaeia archaeon]|nr:triose-phosphate isomerase [Candidatus Bathyarchaeia archaeon]